MIEMSTSGMVLRSLIVALPCSVLSCVVTLWIVMPSTPAPSLSRSAVGTEEIRDRLDELRRAVEASVRDVEQHVPVPALERQPVSEGDPLTAQLNDVLGRLDRLERILTSSAAAGGGGQAPVARSTPINWSELETLVRWHQRDRKAAQRSTILLTPAEVVAKFGRPTEVGGRDGGGIYFAYQRTTPDGTKHTVALFNFQAGYLTYHQIYLGR